MKILITGSSGFVGRNLSTYFQQQQIVTNVLSLRNNDWKVHIDNQADAIIHLAGKAHDTSNTSEEYEYFKVNRDLTICLFDEFLKSDIKDFFFFSSVKAVADSVSDVLFEHAIGTPKTPYGRSKFEAENYLLSKELSEGKRLFVIRPCMIHGPGNKGNLNLLYKIVSKNIPWPLGAFDNKRSFCSIDNLLFVIKELIEREDIPSGIYNLADDKPLSTNELISLIAESQNRKPNVWKIPKGFIERLAKLGDVLHFPLNSERLQKLTDSYIVSNQKIKDAIGKPLPVSSRDGLLKTIKSFKQL